MRFFRRLKKIKIGNSGMTLVEVMIAGALFAMVSVGVSSYLLFLSKNQSRQIIKSVLGARQQEIIRHLMDNRAFTNTLNHSDNDAVFACARTTPQTCRNTAETLISVLDRRNQYVYESVGVGRLDGFDRNGQPCTRNTAGTDDSCPFEYTVEAEIICRHAGAVSTICTNVLIKIEGYLVVSANDSNDSADVIRNEIVNTDRYAFMMFRQTGFEEPRDIFEAKVTAASGVGGGACAIGNNFRGNWTVTGSSLFGTLGAGVSATSVIQLATGNGTRGATYHCRVESHTYGSGSNQVKVRFRAPTATVYIGGVAHAAASTYLGTSENAGLSSSQPSSSKSVVEFVATSDPGTGSTINFEVEHYISLVPTLDPSYCMGKPTSAAGGGLESYAAVRCERLDKNY